MTRRKIGLMAAIAVSGILLGPLVFACFAGLASMIYAPTGERVTEGLWSPSQQEAARFLDAYAEAPRAAGPVQISDLVSADPSRCGYVRGELDRMLVPDAVLIHFARGANQDARAEGREMMVDEVEQRSTAFGRGFLDYCLRTPGYAALCRPASASIINDADRAVMTKLSIWQRKNRDALAKGVCTYLDGVRASDVKAGFIPRRAP